VSPPSPKRDPAIIEIFSKAIWEIDRKRFDDLSFEKDIPSLEINSVAMLEVIGYLEEALDLHLPEEKLQAVRTLGDLADVIAEVRAAG